MLQLKGDDIFAHDVAGFRRKLIDTGDGPVRAYSFATAPNADSPEHCHARSTEIFLVVKGSGSLVVEGSEVRISKGDVVILDPGEFHFVRSGPEPVQLLCVVAPNLQDAVAR